MGRSVGRTAAGWGSLPAMELIGEERSRAARALDWLDATRAELVGLGVLLVGAVLLTGVLVWTAFGRPALPEPAATGDVAADVGTAVDGADGASSPTGAEDAGHPVGGEVDSPDGHGPADDGHDVRGGQGEHGGGGASGEGVEVTVHVAGHVAEPGVVTLPAGSRVTDAVAAAGGATERADLSRINLARPLLDGEHVRVVDAEEEVPPDPGGPAAGTRGTAGADGGGAAAAGPIDINRASAGELQALPGIGPALADRIVDHRERHGPFRQPGDLRDVSGIGEVRFQELADRITVG